MDIVYGFFASPRYWKDPDQLAQAYESLSASLPGEVKHHLVTGQEDLDGLPKGDLLVVVPMSGAVQKLILSAAEHYSGVILYPAYITGNASPRLEEAMLYRNAAPTLMDCWAVLRRTHPRCSLALDREKLDQAIRLYRAWQEVRSAKIILIGDTEPWVISNAHDLSVYEKRFGLSMERVSQEEIARKYQAATREEGEPYCRHFTAKSQKCLKPSQEDLWNAARMAHALIQVMEEHQAQGCALACFNLLSQGTNLCLGVSYINDCTPMVASCEGDVDSAITMLMMKKLSSTKPWMANPGLQNDGTINFSHCTAPIAPISGDCPFTLRSHHESGIGVSLQVDIPAGQVVTAGRISNNASQITIHRGTTLPGEYQCACRTQLYVKLEDPDHYLDTALGCHQVFVFEDITGDLEKLAGFFGLEIL